MSTCTFTFIPTTVTRGRKFRGFGYLVSGGYEYTCGYHNSGVDPYRCVQYSRIWDPATGKYAYVNEDYLEDTEIEPAKLEADKAAYLKSILDSQLAWCAQVKPGIDEVELKRFVRNVLRKNHPELQDWIDTVLPDTRDVADMVEKTLSWAMTLKTRPCIIYGRHCPGGKPLANSKKVDIAYKSLTTKGATKLVGFKEAWEYGLIIRGLANFLQEEAAVS